MRIGFFLSLAAVAAWGQWEGPAGLATTDDGAVVYFSSSLRLRGTDQFESPKIFAADAASVKLFAQRKSEQFLEFDHFFTNFFFLIEPELSGDGSVVAFNAGRNCSPSHSCLSTEEFEGNVVAPGRPAQQFPGKVKLSRNGRFALTFGGKAPGARGVFIVDLATAERTLLGAELSLRGIAESGRRAVSSNGVAVLAQFPSGLIIARQTGTRVLPTSERPRVAVLDDEATTAVYQTDAPPGGVRKLMLVNLATGAETTLVARDSFQPCLSNNGKLLLFLSPVGDQTQVFIINTDGSGLRQLTDQPEGILEATLSGNGNLAYAVVRGGRVLRIDIASGEAKQILGPIPLMKLIRGARVPGSRIQIFGAGLADSQAVAGAPLPLRLGGKQVRLGGVAAPLLFVSSTEIDLQIPWEVPAGPTKLELEPAGDSRFELRPWTLDLFAVAPEYDSLPTSVYPGELMTLHMTGLGPVRPAITTGMPAPPDPPVITSPLDCGFVGTLPPPGAFAGLIPGVVGVYQVVLRAPRGLSFGDHAFACSVGGVSAGTITLRIAARPVRRRR